MKKTILLVLSFVFSFCSYAQLNIQNYIGAEKDLGYINKWCYIQKQGETYSICEKTGKNRKEIVSFALGKNKSSSIETLKDLYYICRNEESGTTIAVKDAKNMNAEIYVLYDDILNENTPKKVYNIYIKVPRRGGILYIILSDSDIVKAIEKIRGEQ